MLNLIKNLEELRNDAIWYLRQDDKSLIDSVYDMHESSIDVITKEGMELAKQAKLNKSFMPEASRKIREIITKYVEEHIDKLDAKVEIANDKFKEEVELINRVAGIYSREFVTLDPTQLEHVSRLFLGDKYLNYWDANDYLVWTTQSIDRSNMELNRAVIYLSNFISIANLYLNSLSNEDNEYKDALIQSIEVIKSLEKIDIEEHTPDKEALEDRGPMSMETYNIFTESLDKDMETRAWKNIPYVYEGLKEYYNLYKKLTRLEMKDEYDWEKNDTEILLINIFKDMKNLEGFDPVREKKRVYNKIDIIFKFIKQVKG